MALRVWLPLNGNLNNYGISDVIVTNNGATVDNSGKIGQCYRFGNGNASSNGINLNNNFVSIGKECSISVWVNPAGNHYHYNGTIISSGDWNHTCWAFGLSQNNSQVDLLGAGYNKYVNCPIPLNTWTHLVCTRKNGVATLYKNGIQIATSSSYGDLASDASNTYIGRETYANGYFTFNGKLNDIRIYDHCLSPKEVKEISKGLCLHYKLDGVCNTIDSIEWDCSGFGNNGTKSGSITSIDSGGRYSKAYNFNGNLSNYISATVNNLVNVINSQQLTVSYWCYDINSGGSTNACPVCIGSAAAQNKLLLLHANAAYGIGLCFYSNDLWNTSIKLTPNTWNLLTFVINNGTRSIYLNGNKISSATYSSNLSVGTPLILGVGKDPIRNSYQLSGSISDLRIYATPLSDADIKELYNTSASVDNFGNVYGYEFMEEAE